MQGDGRIRLQFCVSFRFQVKCQYLGCNFVLANCWLLVAATGLEPETPRGFKSDACALRLSSYCGSVRQGLASGRPGLCSKRSTGKMASTPAEPMVQDEEAADELAAVPATQLSLNLLQTIRTAQSQNGLKHGDYGRYR